MARSGKYTEERAARAIQAITLGATQRLAALYAGVDEDTIINWKKRHSEFSDAIKEAEGKASVQWLAKIEAAASEGAWQAAAWKLERRYPHEYGRQVHEQQHTGKDGGPLTIQVVYGDDGSDSNGAAPETT